MFVLIPVVAEVGLDAFGEHLACVVCFVPLMTVKLELHLQDIVERLRAGKQALHRGTDDGKEHLRTNCTNSNFFGD